jgi:thiol:disulfide interchange protein DsbA
MKKWMWIGVALLSSWAMADVQLGRDYTELKKPQPVASASKVEVLAFFSYHCSHCATLDPALQAWKAKLPADVDFRQVQIVWDKEMAPLAQLFATVQLLKLERLHTPIFTAMIQEKQNLRDEKVLAAWLKTQNVDVKSFMETYRSFSVTNQATRAAQITRDYAIDGTPTIVVGGRYVVPSTAPARVIEVTNALIAKVRAQK